MKLADDRDKIQESKERLSRRKAWIDQREKQFQDQYALMRPAVNRMRMDDIEAWKFTLEVEEWELDETIKALESA